MEPNPNRPSQDVARFGEGAPGSAGVAAGGIRLERSVSDLYALARLHARMRRFVRVRVLAARSVSGATERAALAWRGPPGVRRITLRAACTHEQIRQAQEGRILER